MRADEFVFSVIGCKGKRSIPLFGRSGLPWANTLDTRWRKGVSGEPVRWLSMNLPLSSGLERGEPQSRGACRSNVGFSAAHGVERAQIFLRQAPIHGGDIGADLVRLARPGYDRCDDVLRREP